MTPPPRSTRRRDRRRRDGRTAGRHRGRWVVETLVVTVGLAGAALAAPLYLGPPSTVPDRDPGQVSAGPDARERTAASRSGGRTPTPGGSGAPGPTLTATAEPPPTASSAPPTTAPDPGGDAQGPLPTTTAPLPAPAPAATAPQPVDVEIVALSNAARRTAGLAELAASACAQEQAHARASLLVAEGRFEHDALEPVLAACGGRTVGENLSLGYPTPQATVDAWLASPGHRANLLSSAFTAIGVACVEAARGPLCAQVFLG